MDSTNSLWPTLAQGVVSIVQIGLGGGVGFAIARWRYNDLLRLCRLEQIAARSSLYETRDVAAGLHGRVVEHGNSLQNIQSELSEAAGKTAPQLASAVDELRSANERLQAELTTARLLLEEQAGRHPSAATARDASTAGGREARTDSLTLLLNRPAFESELQHCIEKPQPGQSKGTLLAVSASVARRGENSAAAIGDAPLQQLVRVLRSSLLGSDAITARTADYEFSMILPAGRGTQVKQIIRDLLSAVEATRFKDGEGEIEISLSVGLLDISAELAREVHLQRAAQALQAATAAGDNCCYLHNGRECVPFDLERRRKPSGETAPVTPPAAPSATAEAPKPASAATAVSSPSSSAAAVPWTGKEQRAHRRQKCSSMYFIAPYEDGKFPTPGMFYSARFADISPGGCAILLPSEPTNTSFIVALSKPDGIIHLSAKVVRVKKTDEIGPSGTPLFMAGCRFTGRVQATPPAPQLQPALAGAGGARSR